MKLIEKCEFNGVLSVISPDTKCMFASLTGSGGCLFRTFHYPSRQSIPVIQCEMTDKRGSVRGKRFSVLLGA